MDSCRRRVAAIGRYLLHALEIRPTRLNTDLFYFYPAPNREAEYCDERVCLCVCLSACLCLSVRDHIFGTTRPTDISFLHVACGRGSGSASSGGVVIRYILPVLLLFFITPYTAAHTNTKKAKIHLKYNLKYIKGMHTNIKAHSSSAR